MARSPADFADRAAHEEQAAERADSPEARGLHVGRARMFRARAARHDAIRASIRRLFD